VHVDWFVDTGSRRRACRGHYPCVKLAAAHPVQIAFPQLHAGNSPPTPRWASRAPARRRWLKDAFWALYDALAGRTLPQDDANCPRCDSRRRRSARDLMQQNFPPLSTTLNSPTTSRRTAARAYRRGVRRRAGRLHRRPSYRWRSTAPPVYERAPLCHRPPGSSPCARARRRMVCGANKTQPSEALSNSKGFGTRNSKLIGKTTLAFPLRPYVSKKIVKPPQPVQNSQSPRRH